MNIRKAIHTDSVSLEKISMETFSEAYAAFNKATDIDFYNSNHFTANHLKKELVDKETFFFLAEQLGEIGGYCMLKLQQNQSEFELHIARIYIYKKLYGTGMGQLLMQKATEFALENKCTTIKLVVWKENKRAVAFYQKTGFTIVGETTFDWGTGKVDEDWVMVKTLL